MGLPRSSAGMNGPGPRPLAPHEWPHEALQEREEVDPLADRFKRAERRSTRGVQRRLGRHHDLVIDGIEDVRARRAVGGSEAKRGDPLHVGNRACALGRFFDWITQRHQHVDEELQLELEQ